MRHYKTLLNKNKIFLGQKLNPEILKKNKRKDKFDIAFVSTLKRTISTAKLFNHNKIIKDRLLNEINYGDADGMNIKIFKKKYPKIIKMWKKKKDFKFPSGENHEDVVQRVLKFIRKIKRFKKMKILIVSHNVFLRCLLGKYMNIKKADYFKINVKHMEKLHFIKKDADIRFNLKRAQIKKILTDIYA